MSRFWPWAVLAGLGAYHGLNPAMGWLFALALGLQEKRRSAVVRALLPIALGHAAAVAVTILLWRLAQFLLPIPTLKLSVAALLFALGAYRLFRASHPRGAGMRVGAKDLLVWSFLMASAHGAGLMLLPVLLAQPMPGMTHASTGAMPALPGSLNISRMVVVVVVHTVSMLAVAGVLAILFFEAYEKFGLHLLQKAWLNFDLIWAVALLLAGAVVLLY